MVKLYLSEIDGAKDKRKFEQIYQNYRQKMFSVAYGILQNKEDAEDAVEDAFEVILKKLDVIQDIYSDETWGYLLVIVRNKAIRIYNKNKKRKERISEDFDLMRELSDEIQDVESKTLQKELSDIVAHALLELPERCRTVIYLHYCEEMSYADIGRVMDTTESNARQIARRGRKLLECKLREKSDIYE